MKTLIAIPCHDQMDTAFVQSLTKLETVGETDISFVSGSLIYDARNELSEGAIANGYDYVLWLDSDMVFESDLMRNLFTALGDDDFITGLYFSRRLPNIRPLIWKKCRANVVDGLVVPDTEEYRDYQENEIFEIEGCGFGCVLMKTEMLSAISDKMGYPFNPAFGFGEDLAFCLRAKQMGYKLLCDSSIKLGHIMKSVSDEQTYMLSRNIRKSGS